MSTPRPGTTPNAGFTIIEVMVAIMILSISVVSIYGVQFAAMATVGFSDFSTKAIQLARCRMSEIELEVQVQNGFEEADVSSGGDCCELMEGDADDFTCRWEIMTVEIPDLANALAGGSGGSDAGVGGLGGLLGMGLGGTGGLEGAGGLGGAGGAGDLGALGALGGLGDTGMLGMAASLAPMLTELLKQAVRRVTVTVEWEQGLRKREFVLSQFLVHPTQGPLQMLNAAATASDAEDLLQGTGAEGASSETQGNQSGAKGAGGQPAGGQPAGGKGTGGGRSGKR